MKTSGDLRFDGRVAVVTGGGRGIGRAYALLLAERGAAVVVNNRASAERGDPAADVVAAIRAAGGQAVVSNHDVATEAGADGLIALALAELGGLDVVINNAGVVAAEPMATLTPDAFAVMLTANAFSAFCVTHAAWPHLVARGYGRVVMTGSWAAVYAHPGLAHYAASKGAVLGLVRALSAEGAEAGITVNGVLPAAFTQTTGAGRMTADERALRERAIPAELVAPVVAWLVHESTAVTGALFEAGAGRAARLFVGSAPGYAHAALTPELLRDHAAEIASEEGYATPRTTLDAFEWMLSRVHSFS